MWWTLPDGSRGLARRPVANLPLFGAERLSLLADRTVVVLTEGEKAGTALLALGIPAVGTVTGASSVPCDDVLRPLVRLSPVLWADADEPGRIHMASICKRLRSLGASVSVLTWPESPPGGDAADFIDVLMGRRDAVTALMQGRLAYRGPIHHLFNQTHIFRLGERLVHEAEHAQAGREVHP